MFPNTNPHKLCVFLNCGHLIRNDRNEKKKTKVFYEHVLIRRDLQLFNRKVGIRSS